MLQWHLRKQSMREILRHIKIASIWWIRHVPLISGLPDCKLQHCTDAAKEVFVNLLLSTSPLWLGSLITFSINTGTPKTLSGYGEVLLKSLSHGAMLIYATAAISPIFYFALTRPRNDKDFPSRLSHVVFGLLIFMICTALFGVQRSGVKIDPNFVLPGSIIIYSFSTAIIFVATIYRNWRDASEEFIRAAENEPRAIEQAFVQSALSHRP